MKFKNIIMKNMYIILYILLLYAITFVLLTKYNLGLFLHCAIATFIIIELLFFTFTQYH